MKKFLLSLLPVVVFAGCVKEITKEIPAPEEKFLELTADEIKFLAERNIPSKFNVDEIDRIVADVVSMMEGTSSTRSGGRRTVAGIRPFTVAVPTAGSTRTGTGATLDTLFHIVDFDNGEGYCIVAADRRIPDEVVCFVEHGSFPEAFPPHPIENPGLALMMDATRIYGRRSLARHSAWSDSVSTALLRRTGVGSVDQITTPAPGGTATRIIAEPMTPSWYANRQVGPLLPVEWGQGSPFNTTVVENTAWARTPVGCVALAAVQVMAYWQHPTQYHGLANDNIDWKELVRWTGSGWEREGGYGDWDGPMSAAPDSTKTLIADILWHVGSDIKMNYGPYGSSAYTNRATALLSSLGFSEATIKSYSHETIQGSILAKRPVIIDGASYMSDDGRFYSNSHAWVIDGYFEQRQWEPAIIDCRTYEIERFRDFFHNNFGWDGTDNGWYACGLFDANNDPDIPSNTRAEWFGENYNYQFLITIFADIYK